MKRWIAIALLLLGCTRPAPSRVDAPSPAPINAPKLRVLGIAQDAGVPQAACDSPACEAARRDPSKRQLAASLAVALPDGEVWLVDATPDIREQLDVVPIDYAPFASMDELPGRDIAEIAHPTVESTIELLGDRVARGDLEVVLIHLNHSNPLLDPSKRGSLPRGFTVAEAGLEIPL